MACCQRKRSQVFSVIIKLTICCLVVDLLFRLITGQFLISRHLAQAAQRITTPWNIPHQDANQGQLFLHPRNIINEGNEEIVQVKDNPANDVVKMKDENMDNHLLSAFKDNFPTLEMALQKLSTVKKEIILIYTNNDLINFAKNFLKVNEHLGNGVKSFLFVTEQSSACEILRKENVPCWLYEQATQHDGQCVHYTALNALKLNYTVQIIEYDVILIWGTLCHLAERCDRAKSCQAAASAKDKGKYYDGAVLYLHPTPGAIAFEECLAKQYQRTKLQNKIGSCVDKAWKVARGFEVQKLSEAEYSRGHFKLDETSQAKAVCVNRNWDPVEAVYFMKESKMWFMNDPEYFSVASNRYLTYNNDWLKAFKDPSSVGKERDALKNAFVLGDILNRTLILPKFHCWWYGYNCLITMVASPVVISTLPYRESSFLEDSRTDPKILKDQSVWYIVDNTETYTDHLISLDIFGRKDTKDDGIIHLKASNIEHVTKEEVLEWFGGVNSTVLRLLSTYGMDLCQGDRNISKICQMF